MFTNGSNAAAARDADDDHRSPNRRAIDIAVGVLICIGIAIAAMPFLAKREANPPPASHRKNEPISVGTAQSSPRSAVVDRRTDFQGLLASLRAQRKAGVDCLDELQRVALTRPALAIDLALALSRDRDETAHWVTELTRAWAARDAQAAWDWLAPQMPRLEPVTGNSLISVVLDEMTAQSPQRVLENVDTLLRRDPVEDGLPALVACQLGLAALLAHGDLDLARAAVEDWAQNPRAQAIDGSAFNLVADAVAQDSWRDAAAWLETLPPSAERNSAFAVLASKWADQDPRAALDWAETLGAENGQFVAIRSVFADWVDRDGSGAGEWLSRYIDRAKSESEIDQLIGSFVTFSAGLERDPSLAMGWVGLMRDRTQRDVLTQRVIVRWGQRDSAAAIRYVDTAPALSPLQRQKLKADLTAFAADPEPVDD